MKPLSLCLLAALPLLANTNEISVDASTLNGKVLTGYAGWFLTPTDGSGQNRWWHWTGNAPGSPTAENARFDAWPDLSDFGPNDLAETPELTNGGKPMNLYSNWSPTVVMTHFSWMQQWGIDGVLLQRFVVDIAGDKAGHEQVLKNVMAAAKATGRTWAIEYDVTGADMATVVQDIESDWQYLNSILDIANSPGYLHQNGKPVVGLWGLGFSAPGHLTDPVAATGLISWFKTQTTVIGGVPGYWRTLTNDSVADPRWSAVYAMFDVIEPWTIGRYADVDQANYWATDEIVPDVQTTENQGQEYMPVIFPGFSWHNLEPNSPLNQVPRLGGKFLWRQAYQARAAGASMVKVSVFDEVNEGTAIFKIASKRSEAPDQGEWLTLDADGLNLPSDWYMRLTFEFGKAFHSGTQVPEDLPVNPGATVTRPPTVKFPSKLPTLMHPQSRELRRSSSLDGIFEALGRGDRTLSPQRGILAFGNGAVAGPPPSPSTYVAGDNLVFVEQTSTGSQIGSLNEDPLYQEGNPSAAATGDFNGDGVVDIASTLLDSNSVLVLIQPIQFKPSALYPVGKVSVGVAAGDFNGDGHLDIAAVNGGIGREAAINRHID
jgi:hypothetical protein